MQASDLVEIALRHGFTRKQVSATLKHLNQDQIVRFAWMLRWAESRHEHQIVPAGQWSTWLILGGRGAGKTRVGAEWMGMRAASSGLDANGKLFRGLVAAPTQNDLRKVCFAGESGLISVIPTSLLKRYNKTDSEIELHNGAIVGGIAAENSTRFRGPQWHCAWADEVAAWGDNGRDPQDAWDTMALSVRLGNDTRLLATTTPRPLPHIKALIADPSTVVTTASTFVNLDNLSPEFAKRLLKYDGTKIGRQEIYAEMLDAEEGGIVKRGDLKLWEAGKPFPRFEFIVMSLDTAFSEESYDKKKAETDPSACSVWGCFIHKGRPSIMLLDCWAEKLGFPDLVEKVLAEKALKYGQTDMRPIIVPYRGPKQAANVGHPIDLLVIEGKASGKSLIQQLAKEKVWAYEYNPGKASKLTRLHIVSPLPAHGTIWVPESPSRPGKFMTWADPLVDQLCSFSGEGTVLHDDLLDTTTQAWRVIEDQWLRPTQDKIDKQKAKGREDTIEVPVKRAGNPYAA